MTQNDWFDLKLRQIILKHKEDRKEHNLMEHRIWKKNNFLLDLITEKSFEKIEKTEKKIGSKIQGQFLNIVCIFKETNTANKVY